MSENEQLLSINESADIAGVSTETLEQYRDFGLLEAVVENEMTRFRESDIRTLFYTKLRKEELSEKAPEESPKESTDSDTASTLQQAAPITAPPKSNSSDDEDLQEPPTLEQILAEHAASKLEAANVEVEVVESSEKEEVVSATAEEKIEEVEAEEFHGEAVSTLGESIEISSTSAFVPSSPDADLIELTKGLREQIEMLKEERSWLRERVEKLESRSERDQMLLLSENETVRSLLGSANTRPQRVSFWRKALPFLTGQEN